jgi:hypothetical protein
MKKKRTKILIDPIRQIKAAIIIMSVNIAIFCVLFFAMHYVSRQITVKADIAAAELSKTIETEDNIVKAFLEFARTVTSDQYDLASLKVFEDHDKSMVFIRKHTEELQSFKQYAKMLFYGFIAFQIILALFLFWFLIRFFHRVSGPEAALSVLVKRIASNKPIENRSLRKGDFLFELHRNIMILAKKRGLLEKQPSEKSKTKIKRIEK